MHASPPTATMSTYAEGRKDRASFPVKAHGSAKAQSPPTITISGGTSATSPMVMQHLNAAVLNGVTYPSAKAAAIAKEAVDAAQLYYNLFFQANEGMSTSVAGVGDGNDGSARSGYGSALHAFPNRVGHDAATNTPESSVTSPSSHAQTSREQRSTSHTQQLGPVPGGEDSTPPTEKQKLPSVDSQEDVQAAQQNNNHSDGAGAVRHTGKEESLHDSRTSSVQSNETSLVNVHTPVNVVDTTYHTFFPPVLSRVKREAIVECIVGHRPRPYHKWQWRKAEDYHTLYAQNVHHNNAYHVYSSSATSVGGSPFAASPVVSASSVKAIGEVPLSISPLYPTANSTGLVVGAFNGSRTGVEDKNVVSPVQRVTPKPANFLREVAPSTSPANVGGVSVSNMLNNGTVDGGAAAAAPATALSKVPSFLLNGMPFELMSQLSMYTIPASQQGPEYFKKTAEDGTKTLIIFMMGLPARGKTFLAQKICRLLGWHGSRAKVQNIQVAWRRVLLDWEATHADQLAMEQTQKDAGDKLHCEGCGNGRTPIDPNTTTTATTTTPTPEEGAQATGTPTAMVDESRIQHTCWRAHALCGQHPSDSSTQDEVSRVVRDLATGGSLRRFAECGRTAMETTSLTTATRTNTADANKRIAVPGTMLSPPPLVSDGASNNSNSPLRSSLSASPVCPSMEPYTTDFPTCNAFPSLSSPAVVSPTTAAVLLPDGTVNASAALHSHLESPMLKGDASRGTAAPTTEVPPTAAANAVNSADKDKPSMPAEVLRTRHFKDLILDPSSVARRLYRYVLQSFADDCRLFFQHGGEVVVINDDFVTEELRQEAEKLFRPLAAQFFYMEVIRDGKEDPLHFVQCKIRDPIEYPRSDIDLATATDDFNARLRFLESVYETLEEAPKSRVEKRVQVAPRQPPAGGIEALDGHTHSPPRPLTPQLPRSYVKIRNANTIETHGISGYLPSRIISYVMNLSQVKIQHPIFFVRHGESCYNLENRIGGNPLLTEQGMRDAGALLEFLASLKDYLKRADLNQRAAMHPTPPATTASSSAALDYAHAHDDSTAPTSTFAANSANTASSLEIWTSQLRRAIQTAELSERLLNIRTLRWSSLNEIHAGVCEDMTYDEVIQRYPLIDYFRNRSKYTFRYPEGESYQDLVVRLEPVIMELENADKVVVVVAHQAVLRCLLAYFGSTSAESSISVEVPHRTVWRCTYNSKGIASLDELKLNNYEAGFQLRKPGRAPTATPKAAASETDEVR